MNAVLIVIGAIMLNVALFIIGVSLVGIYTTSIIAAVIYISSLVGFLILAFWAWKGNK